MLSVPRSRAVWRGKVAAVDPHFSFEDSTHRQRFRAVFFVLVLFSERRRGRQVVRQRSAKPLSAVRFRPAPPNPLDIRRNDDSNAQLPPVCHGAGCCCHQTQSANTPEDTDRFLGGKMPGPKDLKRLTIRSWVSTSRECSHSGSRLS
jgi:hypothetical protein